MGYLGEPQRNSQTSEHILLCSRSSNIILRILTQINESKENIILNDEIEAELKSATLTNTTATTVTTNIKSYGIIQAYF